MQVRCNLSILATEIILLCNIYCNDVMSGLSPSTITTGKTCCFLGGNAWKKQVRAISYGNSSGFSHDVPSVGPGTIENPPSGIDFPGLSK